MLDTKAEALILNPNPPPKKNPNIRALINIIMVPT